MDVYLEGTQVELPIDLTDRNGNPLCPTSIDYRVADHRGTELVPRTNLSGFVTGMTTAFVTVPAEINALSVGELREARVVELYCTIQSNTITLSKAYAIEVSDPLRVGVNTFQSYAEAELVALDIPNLNGWVNASEQERTAALIDARLRIAELNFAIFDKDSESDVVATEGTSSIPSWFASGLTELTAAQFSALPADFIQALKRAQVAEADSLLEGDPLLAKRQAGIILESIGDTKLMLRSDKPINLPVCKRALSYLARFITYRKKAGRA